MKAFACYTGQNKPGVGIQIDGRDYDFTKIWSTFKFLQKIPQAPEFMFLQLVVEMEYFSKHTLMEVFAAVQETRSMDDFLLNPPYRFDVPVSRPQKILCLGRNYLAHAKEWKSTVPDAPMFFGKLASSLLPHEGQVRIPKNIGRVDHEIELAVVIGETAYRVNEENALDHVAGYTIANDITARDMQGHDIKNGRPWTLAKGLDTFCPMGPFLVPADVIADPHNLGMELKVNGVTKQKANTGEMVFKVNQIIAYISQYISLQPGDIICTGTPEGTLPIVPGDVIEASIEGLGTLSNSVVEG
jgi:5-oxopent-3-ene-1,2,5-tricarboxylate decarboxylase / 2-hydroxyhepta-2,4-diene-1,7-dioate isomerase